MKSHTDLEQSKKLVEILPIESADMFYDQYGVIRIGKPKERYSDYHQLPVWSLAALIGILPRFIEFKGDKYYLRFMKEYVEYANDEVSITSRCLHTIGNDNLVDACVEMILKLHEQNIL